MTPAPRESRRAPPPPTTASAAAFAAISRSPACSRLAQARTASTRARSTLGEKLAPRRDVFPRISDARARTVTSDAHPVHASARAAHSFHLARMDSSATKSPGPARRRGIDWLRSGLGSAGGGGWGARNRDAGRGARDLAHRRRRPRGCARAPRARPRACHPRGLFGCEAPSRRCACSAPRPLARGG